MKLNETQPVENWKAIDGTTYEISDLGNIRSNYKNGKCRNLVPMTNGQKENDYLFIKLDGKKHYIHQLVLEAFVGKKPKGFECDHLNKHKQDNRLENLRYLILAENRSHAGEAHPTAKLNDSKVKLIRMMYESKEVLGITQKKLANMFDVTSHAISNVITRRTWSHI
jgi:hypothetical protein